MKIILYLALTTLLTTDAFTTLTPWDKEVVYTWKALVKAGTLLPTQYASQFGLQGKIHLQSNSNSSFVKITDLSYHLYNGILDHVHEHEAHEVPLPPEVHDLNNVFKIVYNEDGLVTGIVTEADEKDFSRNIKKAIATILQMKKSVVDKVYQRSEAFVIKEESIYGHGLVHYVVVPGDDVVEVHKSHDMADPDHLYTRFVSNTETGLYHCDVKNEDMVMRDSRRKYVIVKQDGHHIAKQIVANGAIVYHPYKAQSDSQYILVNQTFDLDDVASIKEHFHIKQEYFEDSLIYHSSSDGVDADVASGRHVVNFDKLIPLVQDMLKDIPQYLQEDRINTQEPDGKRGQLVDRVQRVLAQFNVEKLEELQKTLPDYALKVFYSILPLVSTDASVIYIKNLVVKKLIHDDVAVTLLQRMSEFIAPSIHLLSQVEDLIHLDASFSWNVRKVAILTFGSLIHKSYIHTKRAHLSKSHEHDDQHIYEKYINEYLSTVKASNDYKTQTVYLLGLHNMKLPILVKHLVPTFNGELWEDPHLRFLGLLATSVAVVQSPDPNTIIETIWPIFTNRTELTELRILAYYYIMFSQPSHSSLRNLFPFMIHEPNKEVHHFHYTYLQAAMQSTNPCKQEMRTKLAQVMKFTAPPGHGMSSASFYNYEDVNYEFGGEVEQYFIKTNGSRIHTTILNSQHFNRYEQYLLFYLRVNDGPGHPTGANSILETIAHMLVTTPGSETKFASKEQHIDVGIMQRGQVVDFYNFDKDNIHEILDIIKPLKKHKVLTQDLLYINYHWYHRALIPTDLGIPAHWEMLMPDVHHNNLTVSLDHENDTVKLHVDSKYVNWLHFRHGLSFYNPIGDVWHGINRFHSYDVALPLHFDFTLNTRQKSGQLSWTKKDNASVAVTGLRSHVKQMVFIDDLYDQNALVQALPQDKKYQIVSHGKQYRHDYTLLDEDNLSTGHKWYVGVFDSDFHISNGSFRHRMHLFAQTHSKHFNSPIELLALTFDNFQCLIVLMPHPGTFGYIVKIEPSHKHPVTNIDLTFRIDADSDPSSYHYPGITWNSSFTYAIKNKEQSLKTWDVSTEGNLHPGHALANFKIYLTRIASGQKNYKICVEGLKKWALEKVTGQLTVGMSHTDDVKCGDDDKVIDVTMTGQRSLEQQDGHHKYGSCQYAIPYVVPYHTAQCLISHTTLRHYVYDVKTTDLPSELQQTFINNCWDQLKSYYHSYYLYDHEHSENIVDGNLQIDVVFPMQIDEIDVHIKTPHHVHELSGIPAQDWSWFGLTPDSVVFSKFFKIQLDKGWYDHCTIHHDHRFSFNGKFVLEAVPADWTLYVKNEERRNEVYLKLLTNGTLAIKVIDDDHTLEISPHGGSYRLLLDGKDAPLEEQHNEHWIYYHYFARVVYSEIVIVLQKSGIYFKYNSHEVRILTFKTGNFKGHCFDLY